MACLRKKFSFLIMYTIIGGLAFSDVVITVGDVQVSGYTEDVIVPITLTNSDESVGGFQFECVINI